MNQLVRYKINHLDVVSWLASTPETVLFTKDERVSVKYNSAIVANLVTLKNTIQGNYEIYNQSWEGTVNWSNLAKVIRNYALFEKGCSGTKLDFSIVW